MRPVSERFQQAISQSHVALTTVDVLENRVVVARLGGDGLGAVVDGGVTLDRFAESRGRLDLTLADDGSLGLVPVNAGSLLAPYGNELRVRRGIRYPDNSTELVGLGIYRIDDVVVDDTAGDLSIKVQGQDRSARFREFKYDAPFQLATTNIKQAVTDVLVSGWPDVPMNIAATPWTNAVQNVEEGSGRWKLATDLAAAAAMRLHFDGDGVATMQPAAHVDTGHRISEGTDGVLLQAGRRWTRTGMFNHAIVTAETTGQTPIRANWWDLDPASPTYYYGPFGRVPHFHQSQIAVDQAQAHEMAVRMIADRVGATEGINFGSLVLPHLEPHDVATITRLRTGADEAHIIDTLTIPLSAQGSMTGVTHRLRGA